MSIINYIFKIDDEFRLKEVFSMSENNNLILDNSWCMNIGEKIDYALGTSINPKGGIVEVKDKFYKYQWINDMEGITLYLSEESVLLEFYQQIVSFISEGIQIYDRNGYFINSNPASENLQNYNKEDFKGKHLLDIYDIKEGYSTVLTVLRTKEIVNNRCDRFKMKTGKTLTTINTGYPIKLYGNLYGAVVFESDLSVLKKIENRSSNLEAYIKDERPVHQDELYTFEDIIHSSDKMKEVIHFAKKVSLTNSSILITGATGTGKELVAQSIHSFSHRRHKPFIDVNCSAIPSNLFESMFFGTEKGAFTGSIAKQGFFEMAEGGTLFLDEINSISMDMQAKLLRVLQEKRFQRVGGNKYIKCDVRIITASNEEISELMEKQQFRKDFYYRISTIKIDIPRLEERKDDILLLTQHFLNKLYKQYGEKPISINKETLDVLITYDWPGNIRELENTIEYAFNKIGSNKEIIDIEDLPDYIRPIKSEVNYPKINNETLEERIRRMEKEIIKEALRLHEGNITKSARELGMSRQNLQHKIKKLEI
ncbi:sigma-54-dependent Fis family transcriptional regulator [Clostridium malenominatum]|uniref:Sigma-54-dependent Fis family transcriptional regulator n=1 Tax=Clostridium malenominatum TaxID=1539 RepID=A0ABP3UAG7_9CLOT